MEENKKQEKMFGKQLTQKQEDVLTLLKRGNRIDMIAAVQKISEIAVRDHIAAIRKKGIKIIAEKEGNVVVSYKVTDPRD